MIDYSIDLRQQLTVNLHLHRRREHALDQHQHAAVAIVVVDSERDTGDDPIFAGDGLAATGMSFADVPGVVDGLDGRMAGVVRRGRLPALPPGVADEPARRAVGAPRRPRRPR